MKNVLMSERKENDNLKTVTAEKSNQLTSCPAVRMQTDWDDVWYVLLVQFAISRHTPSEPIMTAPTL